MMIVSELKSLHFWASALVELIATFFFIFLTTGTTITWNQNHPPSTELISLSFGFSIASLAMCSLHLSGGHINPAVTIAMMAIRKVNILRGITYVIFQLVGGEAMKLFRFFGKDATTRKQPLFNWINHIVQKKSKVNYSVQSKKVVVQGGRGNKIVGLKRTPSVVSTLDRRRTK